MSAEPLPFSLAWLAGYEPRGEPLTACGAGHLLVRGRTCWAPTRFSADFRALHCVPVDDCDQRPETP